MNINVNANVTVSAEFHTTYILDEDVTIIWQNLMVGKECVQRALVGWYCGEPDPVATAQYANMPLIGQYVD